MTEPVPVTTSYDTPLFDPEDHRKIAAEQMGVSPDAIQCICCGPDDFEQVKAPVYSEDGTELKPRVVKYHRRTLWELRPQPKKPVEPEPTETVPTRWPTLKLPRGGRYHGPVTINGETRDRNFISTGNSLVLLESPEGRAVLAQLDKEHKDYAATIGAQR